MMRLLYVLGCLYIAICAGTVFLNRTPATNERPVLYLRHTASTFSASSGLDWFNGIKPYCNPVEVETRISLQPPPSSKDGTAFCAACYALAGKIDRARLLLQSLPSGQREYAAGIVFQVGHPVADSGDDKSAAPIMQLVLEFMPDNAMALYHAGMAEFTLRENEKAKEHLSRFVQLYRKEDGWRRNALDILERLDY